MRVDALLLIVYLRLHTVRRQNKRMHTQCTHSAHTASRYFRDSRETRLLSVRASFPPQFSAARDNDSFDSRWSSRIGMRHSAGA